MAGDGTYVSALRGPTYQTWRHTWRLSLPAGCNGQAGASAVLAMHRQLPCLELTCAGCLGSRRASRMIGGLFLSRRPTERSEYKLSGTSLICSEPSLFSADGPGHEHAAHQQLVEACHFAVQQKKDNRSHAAKPALDGALSSDLCPAETMRRLEDDASRLKLEHLVRLPLQLEGVLSNRLP